MRLKLKNFVECNALESEPVKNCVSKYDLVSALYCTDIITNNMDEWFGIIGNLSSLIKPGGKLILGLTLGLGDLSNRCINGLEVPCMDLNISDIETGYAKAGFDLSTLELEQEKAIDKTMYDMLVMAIAEKN